MGSPPTMFPVFYCALLLGAFTAVNADTVTVSQSEEETRGSCPDGWLDTTLFGGTMGCLLFDSSNSYTWDKANQFCYSQGGELVEIRHLQEMEFVISYLKMLETHETAYSWWTAGTDAGREGRWVWPSSLATVESYVWYAGEPNSGVAYNCLKLYSPSPYSYKGLDYDCASALKPICQKK